jgi:hypothetical protein
MWIKSLDSKQFTSTYAGKELYLSERTIRDALKVLKQQKKVVVDLQAGVGYTVEVIQ